MHFKDVEVLTLEFSWYILVIRYSRSEDLTLARALLRSVVSLSKVLQLDHLLGTGIYS